jgi:hypothetical protein
MLLAPQITIPLFVAYVSFGTVTLLLRCASIRPLLYVETRTPGTRCSTPSKHLSALRVVCSAWVEAHGRTRGTQQEPGRDGKKGRERFLRSGLKGDRLAECFGRNSKSLSERSGWAFVFAKKPSAGYERRNHRREEFRRHRRDCRRHRRHRHRNYGSARYWNATGPDSCDWAGSMSVAPSSRAVGYMSAAARSRDHCCKAAYCGSSAAVARKSDHCLHSWNGRYCCS